MDNRRAIYIPFAQAVPKVATIDPELLHYAEKRQVRRLRQRSAPLARSIIRQKDEFIEEKYGAIVVCDGL